MLSRKFTESAYIAARLLVLQRLMNGKVVVCQL